ncbi:siderophore-interacting protein [Streptomyces canus]|uniref:siderophore-interacting protein n=1 Tax=Streptomyces canus TaxID=58343 RepID=UPI0033BD6BCF
MAGRPWVRLYTVRAFRPEVCEMDLQFVVYGDDADAGPASAFASQARPGEPVGLFPEGIGYLPTPTAQSQLLVGDESAVPALLSILEQSPADLTAPWRYEQGATCHARRREAAQSNSQIRGALAGWSTRLLPYRGLSLARIR